MRVYAPPITSGVAASSHLSAPKTHTSHATAEALSRRGIVIVTGPITIHSHYAELQKFRVKFRFQTQGL